MVNKKHPDFPEYEKAFNKIWQEMSEELDAIPPSRGQDGPSGVVHKKYALQIKELQQKYSYLFEKVEE